jgi:hypothetical protein
MELEKGGFCMRTFKKAAVTTAAVGLLAFGVVAGSGGSALATTAPPPGQQIITGCESDLGTLVSGAQPNCTAFPGTVNNPSSITVYVNTDELSELLDAQAGQGFTAEWGLSCLVNGETVSTTGTYTITSTEQPTMTTIDLQEAVGSPDPSQCQVELSVETLLDADDASGGISPFDVGVAATASTATPGSIYQDEGTTSSGANAVTCADDTANGNAGSKIQAYHCLGDLADSYIQTGAGQLVHNGDCVGLFGSKVILATCGATNAYEQWAQTTVGGTIVNQGTGTCLTASSPKDGTQLTVTSCGSAAKQKWHIPAVTAIAAPLKKGEISALFASLASHRK